MRKHLIALLGFLSGVTVYYMKAPDRNMASLQDDFHQQEFVTTSLAAPVVEKIKSRSHVIPVEIIEEDFAKEETVALPGLPRGMKFAPHVKALPEESFQNQGKILLKKNGFIFFRGKSGTEGIANVVYDQRLNTFHPLSATIKLTGVNENQRLENLRKWEEYHYNDSLSIQYVQSSHESLFHDYEELKSSGARANLEIIQAIYKNL